MDQLIADEKNPPPARADHLGNVPSRQLRVAILFYRFGPYHHARLNAAGRLMSVWGIEACAREEIYAWSKVEGAKNFTRITLTDHDQAGRAWRKELQRKMWQTLNEIKPEVVVIPGWVFADALSALAWCAATRTPAVIMSESTAWDEPRKFWKEWIKGRLVKLCAGGLAGGTAHADYLTRLGLPGNRIRLGYDVVDNDYFAAQAADSRKQAAGTRKHLGLPGKYFLASARFVEKKNLFRLVEAYARYREQVGHSEPWNLVLLGDGPLREKLRSLLATLNLLDHVLLPGFKQYEDLPPYFALAGAFVHASTVEQWGLVVNEAMASGLPVLVSSRCGCAQDLVQPGVNGFVFDPHQTAELAGLMQKISAPQFPLGSFGAASRRIIAGWGPDRFAAGLKAAALEAIKTPPPSPRIVDRIILTSLLRFKV